jgi:hypothetical protein
VGRKPNRCQWGQGILEGTFIAEADMSGANPENATRESVALDEALKDDELLDVAI